MIGEALVALMLVFVVVFLIPWKQTKNPYEYKMEKDDEGNLVERVVDNTDTETK